MSFFKRAAPCAISQSQGLPHSASSSLLAVSSSLNRLGTLEAKEIMIERSQISAIEENTTKQELIKFINIRQNTRIPVYKGNLDVIIGFIHIKDILKNIEKEFSIKDILRDIIFVPPSMKVSEVLLLMKTYHTHAAIVVDEFGGTEGLITMVDIIEEIIGDLEDEHDSEIIPKFIKITQNRFEVSAQMSLEDFNVRSHIKLPVSSYFKTIGGYICHITGKVPATGEKIQTEEGIEISILEADSKKVSSVIIDTSNYKTDYKTRL